MSKESETRFHPNIEREYEPGAGKLLFDIAGFVALIQYCIEKGNAASKRKQIKKILHLSNWVEHYKDKGTGRVVLSESKKIDYRHEMSTAICLAKMNYDVLFAPFGIFKRGDKKFDIFLIRDIVILKADLKNIYSKNPDTIGQRIKEGSDQASRIVINVVSDIRKSVLIDGLRSGAEKNNLLKEILLIYKSKFYRLPKPLILSKNIYQIIK